VIPVHQATLDSLHADIDERARAIRQTDPDWRCRQGCAGCCKRLGAEPRLTAAEWDRLREGLEAPFAAGLDDISQRVAALTLARPGEMVCPFLDLATSSCRVYAQRPVACRTYGFYVQRDRGLYCPDIESDVAAGLLDDVVWGNQDAIDQRLAGLGESRPLTEWLVALIGKV
jgi:Fe-S-cluster containining protein